MNDINTCTCDFLCEEPPIYYNSALCTVHTHTHTYLQTSALTLQLIAPLNLTTPFSLSVKLKPWVSFFPGTMFSTHTDYRLRPLRWLYLDQQSVESCVAKAPLLCVWKLLLPLWHASPHDFVNKDKSWLWDGTFHTQISPQHNTSAGWVHFSQPVIKQILCWRLKIKLSQ